MGADLPLPSATKFIAGHSDLMLGLISAQDPEDDGRIKAVNVIIDITGLGLLATGSPQEEIRQERRGYPRPGVSGTRGSSTNVRSLTTRSMRTALHRSRSARPTASKNLVLQVGARHARWVRRRIDQVDQLDRVGADLRVGPPAGVAVDDRRCRVGVGDERHRIVDPDVDVAQAGQGALGSGRAAYP